MTVEADVMAAAVGVDGPSAVRDSHEDVQESEDCDKDALTRLLFCLEERLPQVCVCVVGG